MNDWARKVCKAPADCAVLVTDYAKVAIPFLIDAQVGYAGPFGLRPVIGQVVVEPKQRMGYGWLAGYNKRLNLLVIRRPRVDSVEAIGL